MAYFFVFFLFKNLDLNFQNQFRGSGSEENGAESATLVQSLFSKCQSTHIQALMTIAHF